MRVSVPVREQDGALPARRGKIAQDGACASTSSFDGEILVGEVTGRFDADHEFVFFDTDANTNGVTIACKCLNYRMW